MSTSYEPKQFTRRRERYAAKLAQEGATVRVTGQDYDGTPFYKYTNPEAAASGSLDVQMIKEYTDLGFEVVFYRRCGNVAPGVGRWVFDLIRK